MALITFARVAAPSGSWSPSKNPAFPDGYYQIKQWHQNKAISDGGDVYVYTHGSKKLRYMVWHSLPDTDLANLITFVTAMAGGRYLFTFTDVDSTSYTSSRIQNADSLTYYKRVTNQNEVTLIIEVA